MKRFLSTVLLAWLVACQAFATSYFVGPTRQGLSDCTSDANRCLFDDVWPKNPTAGDTIFAADGTYTGASSMIDPFRPATPTLTRVIGGGSMTAGSKSLSYTVTCGGVEQSLSAVTSGGLGVGFIANDSITVSGVQTSCPSGVGTRTKATIYMSKDRNGAPPSGEMYKVAGDCQGFFSDAVTTSHSCNPGPDSGWTAITWPLGISGSSGSNLTIRATNLPTGAGGIMHVIIDGQGIDSPTVRFSNQQYITVNGIYAKRVSGTPYSANFVIDAGAYNITLQNVGASDAPINWNDTNFIFRNGYNHGVNTNNVVDTYFAFGTGRKMMLSIANDGPTTWKRGLIAYMGSWNVGPKIGNSIVYDSRRVTDMDVTGFWTLEGISNPAGYRSYMDGCAELLTPSLAKGHTPTAATLQNCTPSACSSPPLCLGTGIWAAYTMDQDDSYGIFSGDHLDPAFSPFAPYATGKRYGAIGILRNTDHFNSPSVMFQTQLGGLDYKDNVAVLSSSFSGVRGFSLNGCATCTPGAELLTATANTTIGGFTNVFAAAWVSTNNRNLANLTNWTYDGSTCDATHSCSNICTLHNTDGTLSATKRWPHPLNDAFNQALNDSGYASISEYSQIATALGAIPAACDSSAGGPTPTNTFTPSNTPTPTNTLTPTQTRTPTQTPTLGGPTNTPTITPSGCLYWHDATPQGPGYYAYESCGQSWPHPHPILSPTPP